MPRTPKPEYAAGWIATCQEAVDLWLANLPPAAPRPVSLELRIHVPDAPTRLIVARIESGRVASVEGFDEPVEESEAAEVAARDALAAKAGA